MVTRLISKNLDKQKNQKIKTRNPIRQSLKFLFVGGWLCVCNVCVWGGVVHPKTSIQNSSRCFKHLVLTFKLLQLSVTLPNGFESNWFIINQIHLINYVSSIFNQEMVRSDQYRTEKQGLFCAWIDHGLTMEWPCWSITVTNLVNLK